MVDARLGQVAIEIGGEMRFLSGDINYADALYEVLGEAWELWVAERYLGKPTLIDGRPALRFPAVKPQELILLLHALLASDREVSASKGYPRVETPETLSRTISFTDMRAVEEAVRKALVSCFGLKPDQLQVLGLEPEKLDREPWGEA